MLCEAVLTQEKGMDLRSLDGDRSTKTDRRENVD